jgi:hypothetical protein
MWYEYWLKRELPGHSFPTATKVLRHNSLERGEYMYGGFEYMKCGGEYIFKFKGMNGMEGFEVVMGVGPLAVLSGGR